MSVQKNTISVKQASIINAIATAFYMFSFGLLASVIVFCLMNSFHQSEDQAYKFFSAFLSLFFSLSLVGGYLGQRKGYRRVAVIGSVFMVLGLAALAMKLPLFVGFGFYVVGCGFFVPNKNVCLGQIFEANDKRRTSAFTLAYFIMNAGAFVGGGMSGTIVSSLGYSGLFGFAALGVFVAGLLFFIFSLRYPFVVGSHCYLQARDDGANKLLINIMFWVVGASLLAMLLLLNPQYDRYVIFSIAIFILVFIATAILDSKKYEMAERKKLLYFLLLLCFSTIFWMLYDLEPTVLLVFIKNHVDKTIFGYQLASSDFFSLDPASVFVLGLVLYLFFNKVMLQRLNSFLKLAIGIFFACIAFFVLSISMSIASNGQLISPAWIVAIYALIAFGELFVGPTAKSMVGELSPKKMHGALMGCSQFVNGFAAIVSGYLAIHLAIEPHNLLSLKLSASCLRVHAITMGGLILLCISFYVFKRKRVNKN